MGSYIEVTYSKVLYDHLMNIGFACYRSSKVMNVYYAAGKYKELVKVVSTFD